MATCLLLRVDVLFSQGYPKLPFGASGTLFFSQGRLQQLSKFSPHGSWESRGPQVLLCFCVASSGIVISSQKKLEALNQFINQFLFV